MKKSIFVAIALIAVTSITSPLFAQEAAAVKAGYNVKANVKCRIVTTETGCSIVFDNDVKSPRDAASGLATGKRGYDYYKASSEFSVNASDNAVTEIKSPRDAASGLPTGKRMHKPFVITKELDKSTPVSVETVSSTDATSGRTGSGKVNIQDISMTKVNVQDISFMIRCGGKSTKLSVVDGECVIPTDTCPNGSCSLICSWSWGASNSGSSSMGSSSSGRCSVDFLLEIEDGACTSMAINEKGLPGDKKPATTKK